MNKFEKVMCLVVIVLLLLVAAYFVAEGKRWKQADAERQELLKEKAALEERAAELEARQAELEAQAARLNEVINEKVTVIADLQRRVKPREPSISVSEVCRECARQHSLPVSVTDDREWVAVYVRDAFHPEDGATINFLPAFEDEFIRPRDEALADCNGALKDCLGSLGRATEPRGTRPGKFFSFQSSNSIFAGAGYVPSGDLGYAGRYSGRWVRVGSAETLNLTVGADAGAYARLDGSGVSPFVLGGLELKW